MTATPTTRIKKEGIETQAISLLREDLVSGVYPPGTRLTEMDLSASLGVSRGTVRIALQHVAAEGLVELVPYSGWIVPKLSGQEVLDLYQLRSTLEGMGARLAADRITPAGAEKIRIAYDDLSEATQSAGDNALAAIDFRLHETIVSLAGNAELVRHYKLLERKILTFVVRSNALLSGREEVLHEHDDLVKAVLDGDGDGAEKAVRQLIDSNGIRLFRVLTGQG